ncbi:MAG: hypothetical protein ACF8Q5_07730 [Phycisphaerales bacterium JB040]
MPHPPHITPFTALAPMLALTAGAAIALPGTGHLPGDGESGTPNTVTGVAQPEQDPATLVDPAGFADIALPIVPVEGVLELGGARSWAWTNPPGVPGATPTHRLILDGDARLVIGSYEFRARRAAVWLQRLPGSPQARPTYQVYAVLQNASTPQAAASVGVNAEWLPVEGVVTATEPVALRTDVRVVEPPTADSAQRDLLAFLDRAEADFSSRLAVVAGLAQPPTTLTPIDLPDPPTIATAGDGRDGPRDPREAAEASPIFPSRGTFYFSVGDRATLRAADPDGVSADANAVTLTGGVVANYTDARRGRSLELTAERAVAFLKPGPLAETISNVDAEDVIGLYLEGAVTATDGSYTLRAPRLYYDVASSRAIILDAVFWTTEQTTGMPLYVRADALRQEASDQFSADNASLANTAFFRPHFSVGARDLTVRVNPQDRNGVVVGGRAVVDARDITLRAQGLPFFWFPRFRGDPENFPIRDVSFTDSNRRGAGVQTKWNAYALLGLEPPGDMDADLLLDYYEDSGLGLGLGLDWDRTNADGSLFLYALPDDRGEDVSPNGDDIESRDEFRGYASFSNMIRPSDNWRVRMQGAHVSDPLLLENYFPQIASDGPELTNRLQAQRTDGQTVIAGELRAASMDFLPNQNLLQTPGYSVDRLPELTVSQTAADLLSRTLPGAFTHTWHATYSHLRLRFSEENARAYGFLTDADAQNAFGTDADQSLGDVLRAGGLDEELVNRFDTRHEIAAPFALGALNVTPFGVGRFTAWDSEFEGFSPQEDDKSRLWGAAGVRLATEFHTINNSIDSRLFDLHRTRHIVEPSLTYWVADSSIDREDLPVYDDDVENLATGTIVRVGLDQTWQTKRGGAGRWRSVDVFMLDAEYVWSDDEADRDDPIARYYDPRPELSRPGEFARVAAGWQVTEIVALAGETIYDFDERSHDRSSVGARVQHTDRFSTSLDLRFLETQDATYGGWTADYRLTDKYRASLNTTYDFDRDDFRSVSARLYRSFPIGTLGLTLSYNNIRGETSFGFVLRPFGLRDSAGLDLGAGGTRFGG